MRLILVGFALTPISGDKNVLLFLVQGEPLSHGNFCFHLTHPPTQTPPPLHPERLSLDSFMMLNTLEGISFTTSPLLDCRFCSSILSLSSQFLVQQQAQETKKYM